MRFLVDECAGPSLANWLSSLGHDVFSVYDQSRGAEDDAILDRAVSEERILITLDPDFSYKVFRERREAPRHSVFSSAREEARRV